MGQKWDGGDIAFNIELWQECLRVLKPGGHLLAFGGTRTYHRMAVAIEDAGFEIRDSIHWVYGSGFPKSHNVSIGIDKQAGVMEHRGKAHYAYAHGTDFQSREMEAPKEMPPHEGITDAAKQWSGWGTALKPAHEPIVVARKPLEGTVAANVLAHNTGALNIDGCRVGGDGGRWPANIIFDEAAGAELDEQSGLEASRFFYCPKPGKKERNAGGANAHPTVKPIELMRYLCRLVTPPNGTVLDPFLGSGTTAVAAILEGFQWVGCEMTADYLPIIKGRVKWAQNQQPKLI
jgi:site-specific DNA-methyltransferase (adenine-specific)